MKTVLAIFLLSAWTAWSQPAQIILLRHAEKPPDQTAAHLSPRGEERACALVSLLGKTSPLTSNAPIAALYATRVTRHDHSHRTGETLAPLAKALGLPVQTPWQSEHYLLLAHEVLSTPAYRGKTVVICWTHHHLADLAGALGVIPKPPPWKDKVFDRYYLITFGSGKPTLQNLPQRLLPDDASESEAGAAKPFFVSKSRTPNRGARASTALSNSFPFQP